MLDTTNPQELKELIEIVGIATNAMHEEGFPEFSLIAVNWDWDSSLWVVSFYTDYSNSEYIHILITDTSSPFESTRKYLYKGCAYDDNWELPGIRRSV